MTSFTDLSTDVNRKYDDRASRKLCTITSRFDCSIRPLVDAFFLHSVVAFTGCVPNGLVTTISTSAEINSTLEAIKM